MDQKIEKSIENKIISEMLRLLKEKGNFSEYQLNKLKELFENDELHKEKKILDILEYKNNEIN